MNRFRIASLTAALLICTATSALAGEPHEGVALYDSGFRVQSNDGDFALRVNSNFQFRLVIDSEDRGADESRENDWQFDLRRARLKFSGHVYRPELRYTIQMNFDIDKIGLKDFYFDYESECGLHVRVGQFHMPFARQTLNSSSRLQHVDRSSAEAAFRDYGADRNLGIMIHNDFGKSSDFQYAFGVYNAGEEFEPVLAARFGYGINGIRFDDEPAFNRDSELQLGVGLGLFTTLYDTDPAAAMTDNTGRTALTVDAILKTGGFSLNGAFFFGMDQTDEDPFSYGSEGMRMSAFVDAGYFVTGRIQPVLRYSYRNPTLDSDVGEGDSMHDIGAGLSVYFRGHNVKWQSDITTSIEGQGPDSDALVNVQARSQIQVGF